MHRENPFSVARTSGLTALLAVLLLSGCGSSIQVRDVEAGRELQKAKEVPAETFFARRMENRIKKILGFNWEILYRDESYIYFGYTRGGRDEQYVDELFRTDRRRLERLLPRYESIEGYKVHRAVYQALEPYRAKSHTFLIQDMDIQAELKPPCIEIYVDWKYSIDRLPEVRRRFYLALDRNTLQPVKIEEKEK